MKSSLRRKFPPGHSLAPDPHGGIWIGTQKGDLALFRNGVLETKFPLNPGGDPSNRQIIAKADGSVLAGSENGLVGWRQGKVQRMTTKNGLPCDSVISFIEDKEKRWWLYTGCGVVRVLRFRARAMVGQPGSSHSDPCLRRIGRSAAAGAAIFQCSGVLSGWARVVCERSCRADGGSVQALAESAPGADIHRIARR